MADNTVTTRLDFQVGGDAAADLRGMTKSAAELAESEDKYKKKLQSTIESMKERNRIEADLVALGLKAAAPSPQTYRQKVESAAQTFREREKFARDVKKEIGADQEPKGPGMGGGLLGAAVGGIAGMASLAGLQSALTTVGKMADIASNSLMTEAQRSQSLAESIPVVGGIVKAWRELTEVMDGTTDRIRVNAEAHALETRMISIESEKRAQIFSVEQRAVEASAKASASDRIEFNPDMKRPGFAGPKPIRMLEAPKDFLDERELRSVERRFHDPHKELEIRRAQLAQADTAKKADKAGRAAVTEAGEEYQRRKMSQKRLGNIIEEENTPGHPRMKAAIAIETSAGLEHTQKQIAAEQELQRQSNRETQAEIGYAQQVHAMADLTLNKERERLSVLKEQEGRLKEQAVAYGGLDEGAKAMAQQAAEQVKTHGFGSLAVEQKAALQRAGFGEFVGRENVKQAEADPTLAALRANLGEVGGGLAGKRKEIFQLEKAIEVKVVQNQEQLDRSIEKALNDQREWIVDSIKRVAAAQKAAAEIEKIQKRNEAAP